MIFTYLEKLIQSTSIYNLKGSPTQVCGKMLCRTLRKDQNLDQVQLVMRQKLSSTFGPLSCICSNIWCSADSQMNINSVMPNVQCGNLKYLILLDFIFGAVDSQMNMNSVVSNEQTDKILYCRHGCRKPVSDLRFNAP